MQCALCNKWSHDLHLISIRLAGKTEPMYICPDCKAKRDREYYEEYCGYEVKKKEN